MIVIPFFFGATLNLANFSLTIVCVRASPLSYPIGILGPGKDLNARSAAIQFIATMISELGVVLPLAGIVAIARRADASIDRGSIGSSAHMVDGVPTAELPGEQPAHRTQLSENTPLGARAELSDSDLQEILTSTGRFEMPTSTLLHELPSPVTDLGSGFQKPQSVG